MNNWGELERAANACLQFNDGRETTGAWELYVPDDYKGPDSIPSYGVEDVNGNAIVWADLVGETGVAQDVYAVHIALANPKTVLALIEQNKELALHLREALNQMTMAAESISEGRYDEALLHCGSLHRQKLEAIRKATGEEV